MLRVGLTGGVATGKSTVGAMLDRRGAKVIDADKIVHAMFRPGQPVYDELVKHFGHEILHPDGGIDRKKLADAAFGAGRVRELNEIVHPSVVAEQERLMEEYERQAPDGIAVVEAALMFEAGAVKRFDKVVTVLCTREQKIERFARRHSIDHAAAEVEVDRRMAAQWPDEQKAQASDYVIDNSGSLEELELQVDRVYRELKMATKVDSGARRETRNAKP